MATKILSLILSTVFLASCVTNPLTGKKELDPRAWNLLLSTAQTEANVLLANYSKTGKFSTAGLIEGAIGQVRTLEGTPTPLTTELINEAIGNVITDPKFAPIVTSAVQVTVNQALANGLSRDTAIETAAQALDQSLEALKK